jgi:hypothetical protein
MSGVVGIKAVFLKIKTDKSCFICKKRKEKKENQK